MSAIRDIPEVAGLDGYGSLVRIPPEQDVPLTGRIRAIIDTATFRRLAKVSQTGLVSLVYPAAHHSRFEHSLGVYRMALLFLQRLSHDPRFAQAVTAHDAELFLLAALLHDLGHWPFCHPIEDMGLPQVPHHEAFAARFLLEGEIAELLRRDWSIEAEEVLALLNDPPQRAACQILASMLSGPIDIDKLDYLIRDSLHAGVPYGRNFDQHRLIRSLCLNEAGDGLAITEKGKTAAEMMVFARYVMFSEVYWHHGVRSATAMLQRAFFRLQHRIDMEPLFRLGDDAFVDVLRQAAQGEPQHKSALALLEGLFGASRRLYKRVAQYSFFEERAVYDRLARRPFPWLVRCAENFARLASAEVGQPIEPDQVLFDAPPAEREVEFRVHVHYLKENRYRLLGEVSPVVRALAEQQFDDYVKRVRLFADPDVATALRAIADLPALLYRAADATDATEPASQAS